MAHEHSVVTTDGETQAQQVRAMRFRLATAVVVALLMPASLGAKGVTTKIIITDLSTGTSVSIADPIVLGRFNVWSGPGVFSGPPDQQTESMDGFIIDWPAGAVASHPSGFPRYEVKFFVRYPRATAEQLAYVVRYERGRDSQEGFVYLPGKSDEHFGMNVGAIHHGKGYEGNWFRASREWQAAVAPLLRAR